MEASNFIVFFLLTFGVAHILSSELQGCEGPDGYEGYCLSCEEDGIVNKNETLKQKCEECYELKETRNESPEKEVGFCIDQYGCDPKGEKDGEILIAWAITVAECLQKCLEIENATGCEVAITILPIRNESTGGCHYHTRKLSKATGGQRSGYGCYIRDRATLTPRTTTSIAPSTDSATSMISTLASKTAPHDKETTKPKILTTLASKTAPHDKETTKPKILTTKSTEFVKPTTSIKTNPDDIDPNAKPWILGFAVKNQVEGHIMMLLIVSLFLFMI